MMISRVLSLTQKIGWILDPNRWMIRLLGLSAFEKEQKTPGLILIQIDGLSYTHLQNALRRHRLPFLKKLKTKEGYRDWHHYSGLPSSTPSIQGELFYGVKQCVPAFKYRDHETNEIFTFYHFDAAAAVEKRLERESHGLLEGGSSYSNIFSGGAKKNAHFCVAAAGWNAFFSALNPYTLFVLFLFNLAGIFRIIFYLIFEFILAVFDTLYGTLMGYGAREEVQFILSRLIVTVTLRELTTLGAKLDIARGLPVIHLNYFGYDDHAHRRGPKSRFAYWALGGIDSAVKSIWKAAQNSLEREYEVWIYSDHGQEEVLPYAVENGIRMDDAVEKVFREMMPQESFTMASTQEESKKAAGCRDFKHFDGKLSQGKHHTAALPENVLVVTAQGPVGFIYPHRILTDEETLKMARVLVEKANIPLVGIKSNKGQIYGFTKDGQFLLPEQMDAVVGADHPYLHEVAHEFVKLCQHPDSGPFVISGWRKKQQSISFPMEYGSHAGPGPHETDGFALLPGQIRVHLFHGKYLRPSSLRQLALGYLEGSEKVFQATDSTRPSRHALRVMTYNVHSCVGMDGKLSPERIARVIARHDPDVIALQELDVGRMRTKGMHQAKRIAELLDMQYHFHSVHTVEEEMYGNAVLSRYPVKVVRAGSLPRLRGHSYFEPRGALWVEIRCFDTTVQLINTHLSFWGKEQKMQAEALCGPEWLGDKDCKGPVILCGDFNALPHSPVCFCLRQKLGDAQLLADQHTPLKTWFGHFPIGRIDHIFVSRDMGVLNVEVPSSRLERMASDHLPLIAELKVPVLAKSKQLSGLLDS